MPKINKNRSIKYNKQEKPHSQYLRFGDHIDKITNMGIESTRNYLENLGERFIKWATGHRQAKQKKYVTIIDFLLMEQITWDNWKEWGQKHPPFRSQQNMGLAILAAHREAGAAEGDFNERTVHFTQGAYCSMWREEQERHAALAKQTSLGSGNLQVVIQEAPRTGLVKPLEKKKKYEEGEE